MVEFTSTCGRRVSPRQAGCRTPSLHRVRKNFGVPDETVSASAFGPGAEEVAGNLAEALVQGFAAAAEPLAPWWCGGRSALTADGMGHLIPEKTRSSVMDNVVCPNLQTNLMARRPPAMMTFSLQRR